MLLLDVEQVVGDGGELGATLNGGLHETAQHRPSQRRGDRRPRLRRQQKLSSSMCYPDACSARSSWGEGLLDIT